MPERIGRYQILGRIGRGNAGTLFKAHDPLFDRAVALKLLPPSEIAVTDELLTRFFSKAQACLRLRHPNIVTVYDAGEDDGRLFIVMELLEGNDLRHVIAKGSPFTLEEKISVMMQVCDGLHFAHQQGIVHLGIEPGNIFLLQNGQVKILGFGVGQMTSTSINESLMRTEDLQYVSPELRQRLSDCRSDIFSVGLVFYEFLRHRLPLPDNDPTRLPALLKTEEPLPLTQLDPSIPADLAAIVERAMRKDPRDRFSDLEQVRSRLEALQPGLHEEETQRLQAQLRAQLEQILRLQTRLVERIGTLPRGDALPPVGDSDQLVTMQVIERDFTARLAALQDKITRAEALAPAYIRGRELLRTQQFVDAAIEFEAILADMPEHAWAREGLHQARIQAGEQRRRVLTTALLRDARVALDGGAYARCLEIVGRARTVPPPAAMIEEITALTDAADAALKAEEAKQRERRSAEQGREEMV